MRSQANLVIRSAHTRDHTPAVDVLVDAFRDGAVLQWADPDPASRAQLLRPYFTALLEHAAIHGTIRIAATDSAPVGVAVWFPHPLDPAATDVHDLNPSDADGMLFTDGAQRLGRLEQPLKARHPTSTQHRYLAYLGVCAQQQNRGIGTALITDHHTGLDRLRTPAYLEANDPRNRALYLRLGYTDHGEPITVDGCPPVQPMWYQPTPAQP